MVVCFCAVPRRKQLMPDPMVHCNEEITTFCGRRPGGVAFNKNHEECVLQDSHTCKFWKDAFFVIFVKSPMNSVTSSDEGEWAERKNPIFVKGPMDSVTSSDEEDWAEWKGTKKDARYAHHRYFTNHLSAQQGNPWKCSDRLHGRSMQLPQGGTV